jgi:hypothetical protein
VLPGTATANAVGGAAIAQRIEDSAGQQNDATAMRVQYRLQGSGLRPSPADPKETWISEWNG